MCLAARRPRRTVIARSASFSFSLLLVSSSIVDRPRRGPSGAKRPLRLRCCASAAAPRCASLAPCSPRSPLLWVSFNATPSIKLCLCFAQFGRRWSGRSAACRLLSAVARTQWAAGRPTACGPRGSHLTPADPDRSGKLRAALCWLMFFLFFAHSGSEKNALRPMAPAWYGSVMAALGQFYVSSMSALGQSYVSSMSVVMPHPSPPSVDTELRGFLHAKPRARLHKIAHTGALRLRFKGGDRERSSTRRWQLRDSAGLRLQENEEKTSLQTTCWKTCFLIRKRRGP